MKNTNYFCLGAAIVMIVALQGPVLAAGDSIFLFDRSGNKDRTEPSANTEAEDEPRATAASQQETSDTQSVSGGPAGKSPGQPSQRVQGQSSSEVKEPPEEQATPAIEPHQP